jgi:hypothetical protein
MSAQRILSAQLFFELKGNWEHQLSKKYASGQKVRIDVRIITKRISRSSGPHSSKSLGEVIFESRKLGHRKIIFPSGRDSPVIRNVSQGKVIAFHYGKQIVGHAFHLGIV